MSYEYGFLGAGNMGSALSSGVVKTVDPKAVAIYDLSSEKAQELSEKIGIVAAESEDIARHSSYVVLAVKPQVLENCLAPLQQALKENPDLVIVTMAAGTKISTVAKYAGQEFPIIRIMPNTPAAVGAGTILVTRNDKVTDERFNRFIQDFSGAGIIVPITEEKLEAAAVISGCGPAFVYMFMEAMAKAGEKLGIDAETSAKLAESTTRGSALLSELSDEDLETLRIRVCSPGGTTIEGVNSLFDSDLYGIVEKALQASYDRTLELLGE